MSQKAHLINAVTVGSEFHFNTFQLSDGSLVNVKIVDTGGQEIYRSLTHTYYRDADGCLLVYDITDRKSFDEIKGYFSEQIKEKCKKDIKIILLGNKTDLEGDRRITPKEGVNLAVKEGYNFMETSCSQNRNVADSFETLIELTYEQVLKKSKENISEKLPITIKGGNNSSNFKKRKCC